MLDAHEQLIVGDRGVWFGDCMRRDPMKRDSFGLELADDRHANRGGRFTFAELWRGAQSIYRNPVLASVVVTQQSAAIHPGVLPETDVQAVAAAATKDVASAVQNSSLAETLAAWQPMTRH
ncbi:MAG: hypothetical protein JSS20_07740 [Proteobacteria bacterium]|nr:hypothetical protein [Pseudomonadota bacterium]